MPLVFVLIALLVVAGVAALTGWIRRAAACGRTIAAPAGESIDYFTGDVMCKAVMTSGSFGRLEFFDWGVRLHGIPLTRWIVPTWEARYSELAIAELVSLPHSRIAVWLRLRGELGMIGFLSHNSQDILRSLEKHGVPVNRAVAQVSRIGELYEQP